MLTLFHRVREAGSPGDSGGLHSQAESGRGLQGSGGAAGGSLDRLHLSLPKQALTAVLPRRFAARKEWRGADHAVPPRSRGHSSQLREENV